MRVRLLASLTSLTLLTAPLAARAQGVPPPPGDAPAPAQPAPYGPPAQPAPYVAPAPAPYATAPAQPAPYAPVPGGVRVHFKTPRDRGVAKIYLRRGEGFVGVCTTPCTADLHPGAQIRVVLDDHDDEPHDFALGSELDDARPGREVEATISRGGRGALAGGIVMTAIGGLGALVGLVLVAVGSATNSSDGDDLRTAGYVTLLVGGGLTVGGIVLIANRSAEPRVKVGEPRGRRAGDSPRTTASRASLAADDAAPTRPTAPVPAAQAPLTWTFSF